MIVISSDCCKTEDYYMKKNSWSKMSNVKIAIRVRPLSWIELQEESSCKSVVNVEDGQTVAITNLKVPTSHAGDSRERVKRFNFDFCFDSIDSAEEKSTTQEKIFEKLGEIVLSSLARGQNACVLAYGQSASGKTHTMQGTETQPGLAPRLCHAIMEAPGDTNGEAIVSYFEIYNERVRDLLCPGDLHSLQQGSQPAGPSANQLRGLRVREHPRRGPYVEDLSELTVRRPQELCALLALGSARRRSAATQRNPHSSRSHALLAVRRGHPHTTLTLLDLAGSERPSRVNQSISRQKEGANINKSLVALANVISALATPGSRSTQYVPYRDSVLTWLLKDTLSGFTTTIMIATVSPSCACYAETVNTMRWASRAGRIPPGSATPGARGARGAAERSLRALRAEVARLRELLDSARKGKALPELTHQTTQVSFDAKEGETQEHSKSNEDSHDVSEISDCTIKEEKPERENEGGDSLNSLASSRMSVNSNDTLSGNTSIPSTRSNIHSSQAEDLLFGPRLHRTGSVHDVPLPPLRNKKRQYSSHEVLPSLEKLSSFRTLKSANGKTPLVRLNKTAISRLTEKENKDKLHEENNQPFKENEIPKDLAKSFTVTPNVSRPHVSYEPFNKRAVIVASVTDRLYATSRRKEDDVHPNLTSSGINKKSSNELKICSNARKKLLDISYKALRASRRIRPGVPAETQTDIKTSIRVKEVAIDIQDDIEPFRSFPSSKDKLYQHASVETEVFTLLCKEASVGTSSGSLYSVDKSVETDKFKNNHANFTFTRTCGNMTEGTRSLNVASTQTQELAPPRKKYSSFTKYLKVSRDSPAPVNLNDRSTSPRVLNISISHDCSQFENETDGISDDSLENENHKASDLQSLSTRTTPDLLNNHNPAENGASVVGILPQTIVSNNSVENTLRISHASFSGNFDAKDIIKTGNSVSGKCTQTRDEVTSEGRQPPEVTNYDSVIKSKTPTNINQTCDRVTSGKEQVVKLAGVTSRISTSPNSAPILTADSTRANKGVGTDDPSRQGGYLYESKSTQVNSGHENLNADFLENIYVPLPRICVSPNFNSNRWINMRDIIMGKDQNSYPYNIELSPKRSGESGHRNKSKTVSWKPDIDSTETTTNVRSSSPKINLSTFAKYNDAFETCGHEYSSRSSRDTVDRDSLSPERPNSFVSAKPSEKNNFKGIRCWDDRIQMPPVKTETNENQQQKKSNHAHHTSEHDTKCLQYMEATSNLIKEATNLVTSLSQAKDRFVDPLPSNTTPAKSISPICKTSLQIVDEKDNNNANTPAHYSVPSTSFNRPPFKPNTMCFSRMINDELINNENNLNIPSDDLDSDEAVFSSDDELASAGKEIDSIEKTLFDSLDRLEDCTEKTSGYFSSVSARYADTFNRQLVSLPPSWQAGPTPYPRTKRNPSKYLEELRKLRKELVASTKKDDYICRQFKMN